MPRFSERYQKLPAYPLAHIAGAKRALIAAGVDVIDLGAGDADLAPPAAAVDALQRAASTPAMSRYGFGVGHVPFREAVAGWMHQRFGVSCDPMTEVVPLLGSKEGLAHVAFSFVGPDEITIIPEPAYQAYLGGTLLSDATPHVVALRPENNFRIELRDLPLSTLQRTRIVYLNYPNNPTTAIASADYLQRTVDACREFDILLVYDNAYSELAFDGYVPPSIFETQGARDVAIEFHSLSKTYNMTGWRCGWAVARAEIAAALTKIKSFVDTGAFMGIQAAGVEAIRSWADFVPPNVAIFRERRDAAVEAFRAAGFTCDSPMATMYLWIPLPAHIRSKDFAAQLMEAGVIVLPGSGFGAGGEGFFRISFIVPPDRLREAARRAGEVLRRMSENSPER